MLRDHLLHEPAFGPKHPRTPRWRRANAVELPSHKAKHCGRDYDHSPVLYASASEDVQLVAPCNEAATVAAIDARHLPGRIAVELARLPAREATAIVQSIAGMTLTEIGAPMGVSRERVRQLRERGLQRMREAIGV